MSRSRLDAAAKPLRWRMDRPEDDRRPLVSMRPGADGHERLAVVTDHPGGRAVGLTASDLGLPIAIGVPAVSLAMSMGVRFPVVDAARGLVSHPGGRGISGWMEMR